MNIEVWTSNLGAEEVHHFVPGEQNTYIFGINRQLLGESFYQSMLEQVRDRLSVLQHSPFSFAKQ